MSFTALAECKYIPAFGQVQPNPHRYEFFRFQASAG